MDATDPAGIDAELSPAQLDIRNAVADFAAQQLLPEVTAWYEAGAVAQPRELMTALGELGVLGMHLDGYGCGGLGPIEYGLACRELEAADSGIRSLVSVHGSLAMQAIHRFGSPEQKQAYLPPMATGAVIGCFALTEPEHGSDPSSMLTRARRDGSDWVLTGHKRWVTNGSVADVAVIWARTDEGITAFLVPTDTPGITRRVLEHKASLRVSVSAELLLDEVRLPADAVLPEARGLRAALSCLNEARYGIVWGAVGAARSCYLAALEYAGERVQFGRPIGSFQLTQDKLARMAVGLTTSGLLALHLGRRKAAGTLEPAQVSMGKLHTVNTALDIARSARTVLGANGITLDRPVIRHLTNLESVLTYEGTAEMHTLVIGQALTGHAAFR